MSTDKGRSTNRLLAAMSDADFGALAPHLERVELQLHEMLARQGERFTHLYFPETSMISLVNRMADGGGVEVGTIGNEGMAGVATYLGGEATESETFCQIAGPAIRLRTDLLVRAAEERPALRQLLGRYTQAHLSQIAQSAACNRLHKIEQRCARWLLMAHDRVNGAESFPLKQEFLAEMLGVRRAGVTVAAGALQEARIIQYRRGVIRVLDRAALEEWSCECYAIVRRSFDRLLPALAGD